MSFKYYAMTVMLAMQIQSAPCYANEAQASLTNGRVQLRYNIPVHLSAEEKEWYKVFQEGNMLIDGWQKISATILAKTPADQLESQRIALENLGNKIGREWCRPNGVRKVNSSMLQDWGSILKKTAKHEPLKLAQAIAYIDQEVDAVLD